MNHSQRLVPLALSLLAAACGPGGAGGATEGGSSGTTGEGDTGAPTTTVSICAEHCVEDADCLVGGEYGEDLWCDKGVCVWQEDWCTEDLPCFFRLNQHGACSPSSPCPIQDFACVDLGDGLGSCVPRAGTPLCSGEPTLFPGFDGGAPMSVCVRDYACDLATRSCFDRCSKDADCGPFVCNPSTQRCECATDDACLAPPMTAARCYSGECGCASDAYCMLLYPSRPRCMDDGRCGCGTDTDCTGGLSLCRPDGECVCASDAECVARKQGDTCVDGTCTCGSLAGCPAPQYDGTVVACEPP